MSELSPREEPAGAAVRASDDERDHVAALLGDALGTGRITVEEHFERLEAVYAARTRGELAPLTADLPAPAPGARLGSPADLDPVRALFSKVRRGGQWPVPPHTTARASFGAVVIDLRQALFTRREVEIQADSFCGKVEIVVPDDAHVYDMGTALFGKRSQLGGRQGGDADGKGADGPVVRITGRSVFGHVRVMRDFKYPWRDGR
ncbi:DUF1707 SHOCT-like domain-containing protein [Streptomyces sp. NBC_01198]|uniref:DUF1707 SHOCT-like domain-containing protein n=1 Tax=Streptomyces sp. NBC_01198 TaxID=2903769 RepID=UPI002E119623|nr:DUF1707 domain-containing protein [Streptomyces sp. NBC_01198]